MAATTPSTSPSDFTNLIAPRIVICDDLSPAALDVFREAGIEPEVRTGMTEDELVQLVPGVDALVVRSATRITRRVIEASDTLQVIGRAGVGVDNVDCEAATEHGVVVMNTPTGNTVTTAELAISLLCAVARHIPRGDRVVRSGSWNKKGLLGTELTGKTLGVIGLGRIGREVADRGRGLKMRVIAHDPYLQEGSPVEGVELRSLEDLLKQADFVTLHVPLVEATRNLLSRERLALLKPGARLVNAARGGLVDEQALAELLDSGHVAGAAFDVLASEPPGADHPLVGREDVVITPHMGASSHEAQHNVAVGIANQIVEFLEEGVAHNAVNAPAVSAAELDKLAPYLLLAEKMGSFLAQRCSSPIRKLELSLSGELANLDTRPVALSVLIGVLRNSIEGGVNFVNARLLASERGIRLLESVEEKAHFYSSLIKVRASTKGGEESHLVAGTVFGRALRFVRIDDLHLDFEPRGPILITRHKDQPGVVGMIGTVLGNLNVNIQRIQLGTDESGHTKEGELASGFLGLDAVPPPEVLAELARLEPIEKVTLVQL